MKAIIFLNGEYNYKKEFVQKIVQKNDIIFCADGGGNYCYEYEITPNYIIGDLDSIKLEILNIYKKNGVKIEKYNPEKDYTDFELILEKIEKYENENEIKFEKIYVLGGLGKRIDMTLNNLYLLERYEKLIFLSQDEEIFYKNKSFSIKNKKGYEFSIISLDKIIKNLSLKGFKYELNNVMIERKVSKLVSNVINSNECFIEFEEGALLIILRNIDKNE